MWISRFALPFALAVAVILAFLAPRAAEPAPTIPARELLVLAQRAGGASYTYDQRTGAALTSTEVPRPADNASLADLESTLRQAGFSLRRLGSPSPVFLVERSRG